MTGRILITPAKLAAVTLIAVGSIAIGAGSAVAAPAKVVYSDFNTVPATVKGHPNEDTYSAAPFEFPYGGMVQFTARPGVIKSMTAQVDSFTCEHGVYSSENCYTAHSSKRFSYTLTARIYEVGAGDEPGALVTASTERFKIHYRPTTTVSCPSTPEGKGFGANCDVGGYLGSVTFKRFSPAAVLPEKAIIVITNTAGDSPSEVVNVGTQTSYKEWDGEFVPESPLNSGIPSIGEIPLPEDMYVSGKLAEGGGAGYQPVLEVLAKP